MMTARSGRRCAGKGRRCGCGHRPGATRHSTPSRGRIPLRARSELAPVRVQVGRRRVDLVRLGRSDQLVVVDSHQLADDLANARITRSTLSGSARSSGTRFMSNASFSSGKWVMKVQRPIMSVISRSCLAVMSSPKTNGFPLLRTSCSLKCLIASAYVIRRNGRVGACNDGFLRVLSPCVERMVSTTVQTRSSMWLRRSSMLVKGSSKQMKGSSAFGPVLRTADRPVLLRAVARQHAERRPELRDDSRGQAASSPSRTRGH